MILRNLLWLVLCAALTGGAHAACADDRQTLVVYSNGIDNTFDDAWISLTQVLQPGVENRAPAEVDLACVRYRVAYNSKFIDSKNQVLNAYNLYSQIWDAAAQKGIDLTANFWTYWYGLLGTTPPDWLTDIQRTVITSATSVFQPDLLQHEATYNAELALGHTVVVVAHSQGNLYTNQAYNTLQPLGGIDRFHVVAVATPAAYVAGSGPYVTLRGDVINLVPGGLPYNIDNTTPTMCLAGQIVACHSFVNSYMQGDRTRPAILDAVIAQLPRIPAVLFDNLGDRQFCGLNYSNGTLFSVSCSGEQLGSVPGFGTIIPPATQAKAALAFTAPAIASSLKSVELPFFSSVGTGTIVVVVRRDAGGAPDLSSNLAAASVPPSSLNSVTALAANPAFRTYTATFAPGAVPLTSGARYWVEAIAPDTMRAIWLFGRTTQAATVATSRNGAPYAVVGDSPPAVRVEVSFN